MTFQILISLLVTDLSPPTKMPNAIEAFYYQECIFYASLRFSGESGTGIDQINKSNYKWYNLDGKLDSFLYFVLYDKYHNTYFARGGVHYPHIDPPYDNFKQLLCEHGSTRFHRKLVELLINDIGSNHNSTRLNAVYNLYYVGAESDTVPLHPLLLDPDLGIRFAAASTIAKIGGKRDVVALDLFLRSGHWHDDKESKDYTQKMRDELVARLKKEDEAKAKLKTADAPALQAKPPEKK